MSDSTTPYGLQRALLQWHLSQASGYPANDQRNWQIDPQTQKPSKAKYCQWIATSLGVTDDCAGRYMNGSRNIPANQRELLLTAFGETRSHLKTVHKQHAQWEVAVALGMQADSSMYSATCDRQRAQLAIRPDLKQLLQASSLPDARQKHLKRAIEALDDPACIDWVRSLAHECNSSVAVAVDHPSREQIGCLLASLRMLSTPDRIEPIHAVCRALLDLKKRNRQQHTPPGTACIEAAQCVFSLCLMDYVIEQSASTTEAELPLVYNQKSDFVQAALLLDDALGNNITFSRGNKASTAAGAAATVPISIDGYLTEEHLPGVSPGFQAQALKRDVAARLGLYIEAQDGTGNGVVVVAELPSDPFLRAMLDVQSKQHRKPLRISVNLNLASSAIRLDHAQQLARAIGIPVAVFGSHAQNSPETLPQLTESGQVFGDVHPDALNVWVASFLTSLEQVAGH